MTKVFQPPADDYFSRLQMTKYFSRLQMTKYFSRLQMTKVFQSSADDQSISAVCR